MVRHYWVVFKLVLTAPATVVLLLKLGLIDALVQAASHTVLDLDDFIGLRQSVALHAFGGLVVLLAAANLVFSKPAGLTPLWLRNLGRRTPDPTVDAPRTEIRMPVLVKISGIVMMVLTALVVLVMFGGQHGRGAHLPVGG